MAKNKKIQVDEKKVSNFPSHYGSHSSMIDKKATEELNDPTKVVLIDDSGSYLTERSRVDNGLADSNRYSGREIKIQSAKEE